MKVELLINLQRVVMVAWLLENMVHPSRACQHWLDIKQYNTRDEMNVGNTNVDLATVKSFRRVKSFNPMAEEIGVNVLIIHYFIELKHYCYCIN